MIWTQKTKSPYGLPNIETTCHYFGSIILSGPLLAQYIGSSLIPQSSHYQHEESNITGLYIFVFVCVTACAMHTQVQGLYVSVWREAWAGACFGCLNYWMWTLSYLNQALKLICAEKTQNIAANSKSIIPRTHLLLQPLHNSYAWLSRGLRSNWQIHRKQS